MLYFLTCVFFLPRSRKIKFYIKKIWENQLIISLFPSGADSFIFIFDLTHAESFRALSNWINQMNGDSSERKPAIIVGNKSDLEEARQFAEGNGMNYIEVSAERDHNIKQLFDLIARELVSKLD